MDDRERLAQQILARIRNMENADDYDIIFEWSMASEAERAAALAQADLQIASSK